MLVIASIPESSDAQYPSLKPGSFLEVNGEAPSPGGARPCHHKMLRTVTLTTRHRREATSPGEEGRRFCEAGDPAPLFS